MINGYRVPREDFIRLIKHFFYGEPDKPETFNPDGWYTLESRYPWGGEITYNARTGVRSLVYNGLNIVQMNMEATAPDLYYSGVSPYGLRVYAQRIPYFHAFYSEIFTRVTNCLQGVSIFVEPSDAACTIYNLRFSSSASTCSPDGKTVLSWDEDAEVRVHVCAGGGPFPLQTRGENDYRMLHIMPSGSYIRHITGRYTHHHMEKLGYQSEHAPEEVKKAAISWEVLL